MGMIRKRSQRGSSCPEGEQTSSALGLAAGLILRGFALVAGIFVCVLLAGSDASADEEQPTDPVTSLGSTVTTLVDDSTKTVDTVVRTVGDVVTPPTPTAQQEPTVAQAAPSAPDPKGDEPATEQGAVVPLSDVTAATTHLVSDVTQTVTSTVAPVRDALVTTLETVDPAVAERVVGPVLDLPTDVLQTVAPQLDKVVRQVETAVAKPVSMVVRTVDHVLATLPDLPIASTLDQVVASVPRLLTSIVGEPTPAEPVTTQRSVTDLAPAQDVCTTCDVTRDSAAVTGPELAPAEAAAATDSDFVADPAAGVFDLWQPEPGDDPDDASDDGHAMKTPAGSGTSGTCGAGGASGSSASSASPANAVLRSSLNLAEPENLRFRHNDAVLPASCVGIVENRPG